MAGLEVGEQPDFLERRDRHVLRFLDEHHYLPALPVALEEVVVDRLHDLEMRALARELEAQFRRLLPAGSPRGDAGVGDVDRLHMLRQPRLQHGGRAWSCPLPTSPVTLTMPSPCAIA